MAGCGEKWADYGGEGAGKAESTNAGDEGSGRRSREAFVDVWAGIEEGLKKDCRRLSDSSRLNLSLILGWIGIANVVDWVYHVTYVTSLGNGILAFQRARIENLICGWVRCPE